MEEKLARIISYLLHPIFMPTYALLLLFSQNAYFVLILPEKLRLAMVVLVFGNTAVLPAIVIWFMAKRGIISSMMLDKRSERTFPFVISALAYFATWFMLRNLALPQIYNLIIIGGAALIVVASAINLFWKISVHMMGIGGLAAIFLSLSLSEHLNSPILFILLVALSGITAFARLKLNTHSPAQVYSGFFVGAIIMTGVFALL